MNTINDCLLCVVPTDVSKTAWNLERFYLVHLVIMLKIHPSVLKKRSNDQLGAEWVNTHKSVLYEPKKVQRGFTPSFIAWLRPRINIQSVKVLMRIKAQTEYFLA